MALGIQNLMKRGGVRSEAPEVRELAQAGTRGDDTMAHLTSGEIVIPRSAQTPGLMALFAKNMRSQGRNPAEYMVGSQHAERNPYTGAQMFADGLSADSYLSSLKSLSRAAQRPSRFTYSPSGYDYFAPSLSFAPERAAPALYDYFTEGSGRAGSGDTAGDLDLDNLTFGDIGSAAVDALGIGALADAITGGNQTQQQTAGEKAKAQMDAASQAQQVTGFLGGTGFGDLAGGIVGGLMGGPAEAVGGRMGGSLGGTILGGLLAGPPGLALGGMLGGKYGGEAGEAAAMENIKDSLTTQAGVPLSELSPMGMQMAIAGHQLDPALEAQLAYGFAPDEHDEPAHDVESDEEDIAIALAAVNMAMADPMAAFNQFDPAFALTTLEQTAAKGEEDEDMDEEEQAVMAQLTSEMEEAVASFLAPILEMEIGPHPEVSMVTDQFGVLADPDGYGQFGHFPTVSGWLDKLTGPDPHGFNTGPGPSAAGMAAQAAMMARHGFSDDGDTSTDDGPATGDNAQDAGGVEGGVAFG